MAKKATRTRKPKGETIDPETGEVLQSGKPGTMVAIPSAQKQMGSFQDLLPAGFTLKKQVTTPGRKFEPDDLLKIKACSKMRISDKRKGTEKQKGADGRVLPPPMVMDVIEIEDPNRVTVSIVIPQVLQDEFNEKYPGDAYVGKFFMIRSFPADTANKKRYRTFFVMELEAPAGWDKPKAK